MNNRYREEEKENLENGTEEVLEEVKTEEFDIEALKEENKKLKEQYLRVLSDSENFKKRINDERII